MSDGWELVDDPSTLSDGVGDDYEKVESPAVEAMLVTDFAFAAGGDAHAGEAGISAEETRRVSSGEGERPEASDSGLGVGTLVVHNIAPGNTTLDEGTVVEEIPPAAEDLAAPEGMQEEFNRAKDSKRRRAAARGKGFAPPYGGRRIENENAARRARSAPANASTTGSPGAERGEDVGLVLLPGPDEVSVSPNVSEIRSNRKVKHHVPRRLVDVKPGKPESPSPTPARPALGAAPLPPSVAPPRRREPAAALVPRPAAAHALSLSVPPPPLAPPAPPLPRPEPVAGLVTRPAATSVAPVAPPAKGPLAAPPPIPMPPAAIPMPPAAIPMPPVAPAPLPKAPGPASCDRPGRAGANRWTLRPEAPAPPPNGVVYPTPPPCALCLIGHFNNCDYCTVESYRHLGQLMKEVVDVSRLVVAASA